MPSLKDDVADIAALKAIKDARRPDNDVIRVLTLLQEFWLDKGSTAAVDGITVVSTKSGVGRWLRSAAPAPEWTAKTQWYQDTAAGNDENSGDLGSPVRTMAEITCRLRRVDGANYTIHQLGTVESTDSVRFAPEISDKGTVFASTQTVAAILTKGVRGEVSRGAFTATSATVPGTNTQATVTDASVAWSAQLGQILEVTSGAAVHAQAVVLKDLGAGTARVSEWAFTTGVLSPIPAALDTYRIVSFPVFSAPILYPGLPSRVELDFEDITVASSSPGVIPSASTVFTSCRFTVPFSPPPTNSPSECFLRACSVFFTVPTNFCQTAGGSGPRLTACGLVNARIQVSSFGRSYTTNTVIQGGSIRGVNAPQGRVYGGLVVAGGRLGIFDSPGGESAVTLRRGMAMQIQAGASLYGAGNAVYGAEVREGASLAIQTGVTPTVTGTGGDVRVEGAGTAIPELVAGAAVPAAAALTTWAQWAAAPFVRNVVNYKTGAKIISTP